MKTKWIANKQGTKYLIDANDKYMERCLSSKGYQIKNWEFAQFHAAPNGLAIDIGASIGMNTVNYSNYFDQVVSFEPDPDVYNCLVQTVNANACHNVQTIQSAVGKRQETLNLIKFEDSTFGNCLEPIGYKNKTRDTVSVSVNTIDSYNFQDVSFIKIDVEGNEMAVLEGAEQTILKYKPVIQIEIKPQMIKRQLTTPEYLWNWLTSKGYAPKHFAGDVTAPHFIDSEKFSSDSKYGIEYKITFDNIKKNLVDFWFVPLQLNKHQLSDSRVVTG